MRAILTIATDAVAENYKTVSTFAHSAESAAVVKADAYGLGLDGLLPAFKRYDVKTFFVALMEEGIVLRKQMPHATIYILNGIAQGEEAEFIAHDLIPVLNSLEAVALWRDYAKTRNALLPAALHVDTGLNRLGLDIDDIDGMDTQGLDVRLVMSHLACADTPDHWMNAEQLKRFQSVTHYFPDARKSLAASDGIFCGHDFHFDMVRPGAALYGINPIPMRENPLRSVIQIEAPIIQMRTIARKGHVGYAASHDVSEGQRLATVALGYADGLFRCLGNGNAKLFHGDYAVPIVGRISMDVITVDISDIPLQDLTLGQRLRVFHPKQQSVDMLASQAGTIGYEVLTSLGTRFQRVYI